MSRVFWIAAGAAAGIYLARRVQRTAEALTPTGIAGSVGDGLRELADAIRDFADDVRDAMTERENELREALGLDHHEPEALGTSQPAAVRTTEG